jgi:UDP-glucose:(heptosyl)LPS alpha-1,3-glucosyltransferase
VKVGFLIDRWDPGRGGAERALGNLARRLLARGERVVAFAAEGRPGAPGELVRVPVLALGRAGRARLLARELPLAARRAGCDVTVGVRHLAEVDLYWPHGGVHGAALAARREARGLGADERPDGRHRTFVALERALLQGRRARRVIAVSELARAELEQHYPECRDRTAVIENGVDLERFDRARNADAGARLRASLAIGRGTPLVVFAARDPLLKGLPTLAQALARLSGWPWHLLVAGPRHRRPWLRLLLRAGLDPGRCTVREEVVAEALFAAADLTAHPTWRDPCPFVVLESLASGTPVITTRRAGNAHLVVPAAGSVIGGPRAVEELAAALEQWLGRALRGQIDRAAARAAVSEATESASLDALEAEVRGLSPGRAL